VTFRNQSGARLLLRRGGAALAITGALIIAAAGLAFAPLPAAAAAFGISPSTGAFFTGSITVTGSKELGTNVQVSSSASEEPHCIVPGDGEPDDTETWTCTFEAPSGELTVSALQYDADGSGSSVGPLSVTVRNLTAPTIDGSDGLLTTGLISGSGFAGASIIISAGGNQYTAVVEAPSGVWSFPLPLPSGSYDVGVSQQWPDTSDTSVSASRTVIIDKDRPALPAFTLPAAGSTVEGQRVTFAGTGEDGGRVDVFVDALTACSVIVGNGVWSCSANVGGPGAHVIQAIQWDTAGNASGATDGFTLTVASPVAPQSPQSSPSPGEAAPAPVVPPVPQPRTSPSPNTPLTLPFFPPPVGGVSGLPPGETWGTATNYGAAIPNILMGSVAWGWALLLGLGFVILVGLPLRLLVPVLRGRTRWGFRRRPEPGKGEPTRQKSGRTAVGALASAILLAALAGGIQGEVRYLRLAIAIAIALAVINVVGVALATIFASGALGEPTGIRLVPLFLVAAALTALISRTGGIQPPIVVGVIIAAAFTPKLAVRGRAIVSLSQLTAVAVLGGAAWIGHGALRAQDGFWGSLLSEILAAGCIAGLGSLIFLLLPIASMPGRYVFDASPIVWVSVAIAGGTLAAGLIALSPTFPLPLLVATCGIFAAGCLAAWAWLNFVQPQLELGRT
jgi:hypothetical protein